MFFFLLTFVFVSVRSEGSLNNFLLAVESKGTHHKIPLDVINNNNDNDDIEIEISSSVNDQRAV